MIGPVQLREGAEAIEKAWYGPGGFAYQTMPKEKSFIGDLFEYLDYVGVVIGDDYTLRYCPIIARSCRNVKGPVHHLEGGDYPDYHPEPYLG